jgi:D-xylonolactonase
MDVTNSGAVERVLAAGCTLGEGPVWDAGRQCLWFVDIKAPAVHRFDPQSGAHAVFLAPRQVGWILPASDGTLLAGLQDGLYTLDPETGEFLFMSAVPGEPAGNRLNDAACAVDGSVYFGSMDDSEAAEIGRFYRFARGQIVPCGPDGIAITNGPAVSPDGALIYFTDTLGKKIYVATRSADGSVGPARLFVDMAQHFPEAYPDGPVCDAQGYVWTGLWNGWGVARFSPAGELVGKVDLPVANITKIAFGGADYRRVFVTTARKGLDEAALAAQPFAGDVFAFDSEWAGEPVALVEMA